MKKIISAIISIVVLSNAGIVPAYAVTSVYTCSSAYANSIYYQRLSGVNLTGNQRTDIINVAKSQIGYREGSCDDDLSGWNDGTHAYNNYCEYNYWYYGGAHNGGSAYPWCATFVSWCARQANIPTMILRNSSAAGHSSAYFNIPYYSGSSYTPQPGDLFFTSSWSHVGIVESVNGDSFTTIEGNTNNSGSSNGDGVYNRTRNGFSNYYFGVPNYSTPTYYTIIYDANGGYDAPSAQTKSYGQTVALSSHWPSRAGFMFWGWATSPDATVATYAAGGSYSKDSSITLYAVWKPIDSIITYDANGGYDAPSAQTKPHGQTVNLSSYWPSRAGFSFWGWATSPDATVATYPAGGSYSKEGNVTLYAVWKPNLTLTASKNEVIINEPITFNYDLSHSPAVWVCIDKNDEDYADLFVEDPKEYTRSFVEPGIYTVVVCVYNGNDYYETNKVTINVEPNLLLSVEKNNIKTNEMVTFNYDFSYTTEVWLLVDKDDTDYMNLYIDAPTSYAMSFDEPGTYMVSVGIFRDEGFCETNRVTIFVSGIDSIVTKSDDILNIKPSLYHITNKCTVIVAGYKENKLIDIAKTAQGVSATLEGDIDEIKVMVWSDLLTLAPLCENEEITSNEFITE